MKEEDFSFVRDDLVEIVSNMEFSQFKPVKYKESYFLTLNYRNIDFKIVLTDLSTFRSELQVIPKDNRLTVHMYSEEVQKLILVGLLELYIFNADNNLLRPEIRELANRLAS